MGFTHCWTKTLKVNACSRLTKKILIKCCRFQFLRSWLQGFAIGNGLTNPGIQYKAYPDYALEMGIIKQAEYNKIIKILPACELATKFCGKHDSAEWFSCCFSHDREVFSPFFGPEFCSMNCRLNCDSTRAGSSGALTCLASLFICNSIFNSILLIAGDTNVSRSPSPPEVERVACADPALVSPPACVGSLCSTTISERNAREASATTSRTWISSWTWSLWGARLESARGGSCPAAPSSTRPCSQTGWRTWKWAFLP